MSDGHSDHTLRGTPHEAGDETGSEAGQDQLLVIASDTLFLSGDVHRLVTFLNRSLKDDGYIFGLRLADDERYHLTIYRA